ncbi:hypothetical protein DC20_21445 (plasmid) [Rufibacter tibetensis]|uniref:DUF3826 domain-containing protein n=2 Tax=Rufibacter tibetensis TaxID=512763 RepID=A0A0P0CPI3_9BACT|nr:hypothetical protein DC20_21445 [Rufibacter tibetensis]
MKMYWLLFGILLTVGVPAFSQHIKKTKEEEAAYFNVVNQRAGKIVASMKLADSAKAKRVQSIIAQQYQDLNSIHERRDAQLKAVKSGAEEGKAILSKKSIEEKSDQDLSKLHTKYVAKLSAELTPAQVDQVKDGMTYGVVPITYKGYLAMLPDLAEAQKAQIMTWLVEAREHAMDAGSSEKKHQWFGKYKGKINNYLSAEGYDLKKAGDDWAKRQKAEASAN